MKRILSLLCVATTMLTSCHTNTPAPDPYAQIKQELAADLQPYTRAQIDSIAITGADSITLRQYYTLYIAQLAAFEMRKKQQTHTDSITAYTGGNPNIITRYRHDSEILQHLQKDIDSLARLQTAPGVDSPYGVKLATRIYIANAGKPAAMPMPVLVSNKGKVTPILSQGGFIGR